VAVDKDGLTQLVHQAHLVRAMLAETEVPMVVMLLVAAVEVHLLLETMLQQILVVMVEMELHHL
jgi:hypothetical protein